MGDLRLDVVDHVATVTLDRPPVNAVNTGTFAEIIDVFSGFADDRDVRVAIFTAAGDRAFMAGVDLQSVGPRERRAETPASLVTDPARMARDAMWAITDCAVPVIGAINGPALGAGLAFAACCDILIASDNARFGTTEINVGLLGAERASVAAGRTAQGARDVLHGRAGSRRRTAPARCGAQRRPARRARRHRPRPRARPRGEEPDRLRLAKESMNRVEHLPLKEAYRTEQDYTARLLGFEDAAEARNAFMEKRAPEWKWR